MEALAQRAINQRLEEDGGDWSAQNHSEPARWMKWAIMRDAATILSTLQIPAFKEFQHQLRASNGEIPEVTFTPAEFYFLKLATVLASHHLLRLPEFGVNWNSVQAQRMEIRQRVEVLEKSGKPEEAAKLKAQMPRALRRADARNERKEKEKATEVSNIATTIQTPVPARNDPAGSGHNVRP